MAPLYQQAHIRECKGRHADPNSSYSNDLSNIARLAALYRQQPVARNIGDGLKIYWPVYISGIGTVSGGRDNLVSGQWFGRGSTGVVAKVARGFRKLGRVLESIRVDNPDCVIEKLELDVFGFSRGAAAARHFANEVLKQERGALQPILKRDSVRLSPGFSWGNGSVALKVIGLFDTVAAIGSIHDLGNVSDAVNRRVNLFLPPGCAQQVVHLVAGDELRSNFALNSIAPDWPLEIVLPGSHSDIGGGYMSQMTEKVYLTRPRRSIVSVDTDTASSQAWRMAEAELASIDVSQWLDPLDGQASLRIECDEKQLKTGAGGVKTVLAAVSLERQVFGHLSRVYLRVMHALASDEGVPLLPIPCTPELGLTPELQCIAQKLLAYARGGQWALDDNEERLLRRRYIHRSAHWNPAIGDGGGLGDKVFLHAPGPKGRVRHPNLRQPGYPQ